MTKYTEAQVTEAMKVWSKNDWYWESAGRYIEDHSHIYIGDEMIELSLVDIRTGEEGDWDIETYVVFGVGDQLFKKSGRYASHYGNDWEGPIVEVKKVPKTVYAWEEV